MPLRPDSSDPLADPALLVGEMDGQLFRLFSLAWMLSGLVIFAIGLVAALRDEERCLARPSDLDEPSAGASGLSPEAARSSRRRGPGRRARS